MLTFFAIAAMILLQIGLALFCFYKKAKLTI